MLLYELHLVQQPRYILRDDVVWHSVLHVLHGVLSPMLWLRAKQNEELHSVPTLQKELYTNLIDVGGHVVSCMA